MRPRGRLRIGVATVMAVLLVAAVAVASEGDDTSHAWIDAPRAGTAYQAGDEVEIVAHLGSPAGTGSVVVTVDDVVIETVRVERGTTLETIRLTWVAEGSGVRLIGVRPEGARVAGATVDIEIDDDDGRPPLTVPPTSTPTTSPPTTAPPTTSPPPTTAPPCVPGPPSPSSPANGATVSSVATTLSWAYSGCTPVQFEVVVTGDDSLGMVPTRVVVASATVSSTSWTTPPLTECGEFQWRVRAIGSGGVSAWSATWSYTIGGTSC